MIYAFLILAALCAILFLTSCIKGRRDDATERALSNGEWPHLPRDGSRGYLEKGE